MPSRTSKEIREDIINAGRVAAEELVRVAEAPILSKNSTIDFDDDLAADKMKNAAAAKKLAIFDAFDILKRVDDEEANMNKPEGEEKKEEKKEVKQTDFKSPEERAS